MFHIHLKHDIKHAVSAVVAPVKKVVKGAEKAAGAIEKKVVDIYDGYFGSSHAPGRTNWDGFSHEQLVQMLHSEASAGQVGQQSALLNGLGRSAQDIADQMGGRRGDLSRISQGPAASAAGDLLGRHQDGGASLGSYTTSVGSALEAAAHALSRAQHSMPKPLNTNGVAVKGAVVGGVLAGPVGALMGAAASKIGGSAVEAGRKGEAVRVMKTFEDSLHSAFDDMQKTFTRPPGPISVTGPDNLTGGGSGGPGGSPRGAGAGGGPFGFGSPVTGGESGSGTSPWQVPGTTPGSGADLPGVGSGSGVAGPDAGTTAASALPAFGGPGISAFGPTGLDGRPTGGPTPWRELVGGGLPGLFGGGGPAGEFAGGRRGAAAGMGGARGAAGLPGMVPPGAGKRGEDDKEHRNKLPHDEKLFAVDEKWVPPVIGA